MSASALVQEGRTDAWRAPGPVVLLAFGAAGLAAAAYSAELALVSGDLRQPGVNAALMVWMVVLYVSAGLLAWWRRPESRFGILLLAAGFGIFLTSLTWAAAAPLFTVGVAFDLLAGVLFLHVFLAFPSGRLTRVFERALVGTAYFVAFGLQLVGMALGGFGSDNLLELTSSPGAASVLLRVQLVLLSAFLLAGIGLLARRRRSEGPPLRRSLALLVDSFALGLVMIAVLYLSGASGLVDGQTAFETIRRVTFFVIGLAPVAFLVGLLRTRLARSSIGELLLELRANPDPVALRGALARALRDPSLTLAYWLPEFGTYADVDGNPVELPDGEDGRATTRIGRRGAHVAALSHDAGLSEEPELLDAATAAAGIALENAQLHSELRARLEELRGSRARIVEAGQRERQRLERNLHDGAQQRLIALSLELGLLEERMGSAPDVRERLDQARRQIATSLEELRAVARGLHPAVVSGHGLEVALESLAARAPLPVRLTVELEGRLPERLEVAAFYLVSESLANVGKHAGATNAAVAVARAGNQVVVEVTDDGVGGADPERGTGLRGLADRVEALGGSLRVWSPGGGGTRLRAELPCAR
ncbi:MAG TPA: histidine kinase [Gaiellaceae bacterium]|nr:histidine kinase [Gaiellaceae bacterium]